MCTGTRNTVTNSVVKYYVIVHYKIVNNIILITNEI